MLISTALADLSLQIGKKTKVSASEIEKMWSLPGKGISADRALPCFRLAANLKEKPDELASYFEKSLKLPKGVAKVFAQGPFLNVIFSLSDLASDLFKMMNLKLPFGYSKILQKERYILEHTSMNPSGPVHIGRVRNSFIGDTLCRLLKSQGAQVETHYFVNDIGKQIAIIALARSEGLKPAQELISRYRVYSDRHDFITFFYYVPGNQKAETDPNFGKKVNDLIEKAESGDAKSLSKLKDTASFCLEGQKKSLERFNITFDFFD